MPRPIIIPGIATLVTLADVKSLIERDLTTRCRRKAAWRYVAECRGRARGKRINRQLGSRSKAQVELLNPEKSLAATIRSDGGAEQTFRYAPLSSGLDIVRKTLGQHEIATVQTTSVDENGGTINLTTYWPTPRESG